MYKALYISPMIPSYNMKETAAFFIDLLGFNKMMYTDGYIVLEKDNLTIHILNAGTDIGEMEFYLSVDNVDAVWEGMKDKISTKAMPPFDREYGMREIHIIIPHTKTLLFIGQVIQ